MRFLRAGILLFAVLIVVTVPLIFGGKASAHPFFNTTLQLAIHDNYVHESVEIPITELGLALNKPLKDDPKTLLANHQTEFQSYLAAHIKPTTPAGQPWQTTITNLHLTTAKIPYSLGILKAGAVYQKLAFDVTMTPPRGATTRAFDVGYTAVVQDVTAHSVIVSIAEDWASGITKNQPAQVGIITYDFDKKQVTPMKIDVSKGNLVSGYIGMVKLGMNHIRTGTDHLLFLLTLLLPAPLLVIGKRWGSFGGTRRTLRNILKITAAFTIGHSLTLIVATLARLHISSQPVEALIAVSIIVSAIHALRPIFPGKEVWVAGGFGLIHGTAFSFVLAELNLNRSQTAVSLFGFNVGIELMQLLVVAMVIPALIVFARTKAYPYIRIGGASLALVAATGWLFARIGFINPIGTLADTLSTYAKWIVIGLNVAAVLYLLQKYYEAHPIEDADAGAAPDD